MAQLALFLLVVAAGCYLFADYVYPGGSQFNRTSTGHAHFENYLCDLLDAHPFGHAENQARPWAISALIALSLSLVPLSLTLIHLMRPASLARRWVPWLGIVGGLAGCLIFTPLHDQAIVFGFGPTALAFLLSLFELSRAGYVRLALLGLWPLLIGALNFTLWKLGVVPAFVPPVQKVAITGLMAWISCVSLVVRLRART